MRILAVFVILLTFSNSATAQSKLYLLDSLFQSLYSHGNFNGNVAIKQEDKILFEKSYGLANETTGEPLTPNSVFELASCSKQFTAMAISLLAKKNKLEYNDSIAKYIPELAFYKNITIYQLLHHTSGLPDYELLLDTVWNKNKIATNNDLIVLFKKYQPALLFAAGTQYQYSNTGYAFLATIIERVSKKSYTDFLQQKIFEPLKMKNSFVYHRRLNPFKIKNYALGYVYDSSGKRKLPDSLPGYNNVYFLDGISGDGTVNATTKDLLLWDKALYESNLLSASEIAEIFSPGKLNNGDNVFYGFGWEIENNNKLGKIVSHTGGWPGYSTFIERELDKKTTIIILQNIDGGETPVNSIRKILNNLPLHPAAITLSDSLLHMYTGLYEIAPGSNISVTQEDHQLKATAREYGTLDIFPYGGNKFFLNIPEIDLEFTKNNKGNVTKLLVDIRGRHVEAKRINR